MFDPALEGLMATIREGVAANPPVPPLNDRRALHDFIETSRKMFDATWKISVGDPDVAVNAIGFGLEGEKLTPPGALEGKAILYFHGGGQVFGSARSHRGLVTRLAKAAGVIAYNLDYPLAPENPFPVGMNYALESYQKLLDSGLDGPDIVLAGDSGGGNLVGTVLLALRDKGRPMPAGAFMISPFLDLVASSQTYEEIGKRDPWIFREIVMMCGIVLSNGLPLDNPYLSPARADLRNMPPILIQVGSEEVLLGDSIDFTRRVAIAGGAVKLDVWAGMFHAWHLFHDVLTIAAPKAIDEAGDWIAERLK